MEVELHASLAFKLYGSGHIHFTAPLPLGIIVMDSTEGENPLPLPGNRIPVAWSISSSAV
jgi:hypothetical protein